MSKIETWKAWTFVGSLAVIAIFIHAVRFNPRPAQQIRPSATPSTPSRPSPQAEQMDKEATEKRAAAALQAEQLKEAARKRAEDLAAERARYLQRYLNTGFTRTPKLKTVALAVVSEDGKPNRGVGDALARRFQTEGVEITASFFKPEFGSDGLLAEIMGGTTKALDRLELASSLDGLLLARQTARYSTNAALENTITATMRLEVMALRSTASDERPTWTLAANGAGFRPGDARAMAEERLIKQIAQDSKMSLADLLPPKHSP